VQSSSGTFKAVPDIFFQLYSIHFDFGSDIHPVAMYCLLTNKTGETYSRLLVELTPGEMSHYVSVTVV